MIPVKKEATPAAPAISIGKVRNWLLKNVSPPRCPEATSKEKVASDTKNIRINLTDHFPRGVFGIKAPLTISS